MDEITPIKIYSGEFPTTEASVAQVPSGDQWIVSDIDMSNTTAVAVNVQVWMTADDEATDVSNNLFYMPIDAYQTITWKGFQVMDSLDEIKIDADGAGVSVRISGGTIG